jgi:hypothetical protein
MIHTDSEDESANLDLIMRTSDLIKAQACPGRARLRSLWCVIRASLCRSRQSQTCPRPGLSEEQNGRFCFTEEVMIRRP